jgi:hypothetical protein
VLPRENSSATSQKNEFVTASPKPCSGTPSLLNYRNKVNCPLPTSGEIAEVETDTAFLPGSQVDGVVLCAAEQRLWQLPIRECGSAQHR